MSGVKNDIKDEEFIKAVTKAKVDEATAKMSSQYKRHWTTADLDLLLQKAKDEVLGYFKQNLPLWLAVPQTGAQILKAFQAYDPTLTDFKKILKYVEDWIAFNHGMKTAEEYEAQYTRAEKILYYEGITLPIILMFDYQVNGLVSVLQKPTFYSYYDPNFQTLQGKGSFFIVFPGTITHLTDEELMVALKHEFGHIVQGHCSIHSSDPFDQNYQNAAMDISINCGMTPKEQGLLIQVANKLFGKGKYPCLSLIGSTKEGGFNIRKAVQPGAWTDALASIRLYYKKDQSAQQSQQGDGDQQQQQQGEGQQGQGSGQGQQGQGQGQGGGGGKIDDKIRVGDAVVSRDPNNPVYGRVVSIDPVTGDIAEIQELSKEEFDEYGKKVAQGTFGQ